MGPSVDDFTTLVSRDKRVKEEVRGLYEEYAPRGSKA
ncbi:hypothetical protein FOPG_19475 [Fusarium oxysporum f. sp. conglutinans race 2 54008]|uniref:Uncharacterized protein n=1 Tax=Fusarium oxysporum f. sp. conglutinans race 2 54008 TaxID=1089457 RepID=X0GKW3_FUSOX|nr:hypothetical protein FOPG_19475 [Fusarium oxysporum f. sp. conglutinans race 2 54008]